VLNPGVSAQIGSYSLWEGFARTTHFTIDAESFIFDVDGLSEASIYQ
jgi:hypothetical protein